MTAFDLIDLFGDGQRLRDGNRPAGDPVSECLALNEFKDECLDAASP
jgi:hypothetical protein